jgi:pyruvate dehydrogenase (quinone)
VLDEALAHPGAVPVEAVIDPAEPLLPPKRMPKYADNLEKTLERGTAGSEAIRQALAEEPARTLMAP